MDWCLVQVLRPPRGEGVDFGPDGTGDGCTPACEEISSARASHHTHTDSQRALDLHVTLGTSHQRACATSGEAKVSKVQHRKHRTW